MPNLCAKLFGCGYFRTTHNPWKYKGILEKYPGLTNVSTVGKVIRSPRSGINFGVNVRGGGDVNGDGNPDLLVGATWYPNSGERHGALYIYLHSGIEIDERHDSFISNGSRSPSDDSLGLYIARGTNLGFATVGSIDGNVSDFIVGAALYGDSSARSFLFLGARPFPSFTSTSQAAEEFSFGEGDPGGISSRPSYIGDANNDGYADIAISFPEYNGSQGRSYIYF